MAVATLTDEAIGAVRAGLRAVDDSMETLGKHRARLHRLLERLEADRDGTKDCKCPIHAAGGDGEKVTVSNEPIVES